MIYFIRDTNSGYVKIGHAGDPWARLAKIQSDCPGEVELVAVEEGGVQREVELHRRFHLSHRRGEWFSETADLRAYVNTLERPVRRIGNKSRNFWGGYSDEEVAAQVGVHRSMVSKYRLGTRRPIAETALAIQRLTGRSAIQLVFGENADEALAAHGLARQEAA